MINLGLTRISRLASGLSRPTWKAIHIAGTNGKGSVAAYLSSLLMRLAKPKDTNEEIRIGRFTSPHLLDRWDCITVNDRPVSQSLFLTVEEHVKTIAAKLQLQSEVQSLSDHVPSVKGEEIGEVTEFELLTATAYEIFSRQQCQVAVIECGLGGRLDATNIFSADKVLVSVITKIGLDHQGLLGDTEGEIAREKAGIIKRGIPVVVDGTNNDAVKQSISEMARQNGSREEYTNGVAELDVELPDHQKQNLQVALLAFETARDRMSELTVQPARRSLLDQVISDVSISYPGRLQYLSINAIVPTYQRQILLDGAHNPQSATILRRYIDDLSPRPDRVHWVLAVSQGKNAAEIFKILLRSEDTVVFCGFSPVEGMPWVRSTDTIELVGHAQRITQHVHACNDIAEALEYVCTKQEEENDMIVVAGSLYLVSDLLRLLRASS